ncbi:GNAT family N-acetyltransferase [Paenibacillus xylaniclasticus]|uniref:GNAT family N-acetyltransferase n=1 Tax=Paenibacillus xylaniclasticus TaxID=588083 RepID=UPI000FDA45FC|nr:MULTISPECIES: GNAT family protein [Paenibacillus]
MDIDLFKEHIILRNDVVCLEPFHAKYRDELAAIIFDREITKFTGAHIDTEEDLDQYIAQTLDVREKCIGYPFIVIDQKSGRAAGVTRYGSIQAPNRRLEIGWTWYGREYRGTGINQACKHLLLSYAFRKLGCNRVQFSVDVDNARSRRAVEKLGATQEGIFRSNYVNAYGECRDDVYYSIIRSEWDELERKVFSSFL